MLEKDEVEEKYGCKSFVVPGSQGDVQSCEAVTLQLRA